MQPDPYPIEPYNPKTINRYQYAEQSPPNYVDYDGKRAWPAAGNRIRAVQSNPELGLYGEVRSYQSGAPKFHYGADILGNLEDPTYAYDDGVVVFAGKSKGDFGNLIVLKHQKEDSYSYYAHLQDIHVKPGDTIRENQTIGTIGNSGNAKGEDPHLHFEIRIGEDYRDNAVNPSDQYNVVDRIKQYFRGLFNSNYSSSIPETGGHK